MMLLTVLVILTHISKLRGFSLVFSFLFENWAFQNNRTYENRAFQKKNTWWEFEQKRERNWKCSNFGLFKINEHMPSREKSIFHMLFRAFHKTIRIFFKSCSQSINIIQGLRIRRLKKIEKFRRKLGLPNLFRFSVILGIFTNGRMFTLWVHIGKIFRNFFLWIMESEKKFVCAQGQNHFGLMSCHDCSVRAF